MNELTKRLLGDSYNSSLEDDSIEYDIPLTAEPSEVETAQIQIQVNRLQVKFFCDDISRGINYYLDARQKLSRRRRQDVNALKSIIFDPQQYKTKEECMLSIQSRLELIKTGWFFFRGKSQLKGIMFAVIDTYKSNAVNKLSHELMREMWDHKLLLKKYDFIKGEDIEEVKQELNRVRDELTALKKQYEAPSKPTQKIQSLPSSTGGFASRLKGIFG